jgi:hypothetical protein
VLRPQPAPDSPFDVSGVDLELICAETVVAVGEARRPYGDAE